MKSSFIDSLIYGFCGWLLHCFIHSVVQCVSHVMSCHVSFASQIPWCTSQLHDFIASASQKLSYGPLISHNHAFFLETSFPTRAGHYLLACKGSRWVRRVKTIWKLSLGDSLKNLRWNRFTHQNTWVCMVYLGVWLVQLFLLFKRFCCQILSGVWAVTWVSSELHQGWEVQTGGTG